MKIAVSANGNDLDASIDPRFGRCAFFLVVDPETMTFEAYDNENIALGGGAGIQSAQFVASKGAKAVITGNCGPNAVRTLSAAGIDVVMGQSGTVAQAVEAYKRGKLSVSTEPNVSDHYGMGQSSAAPVSPAPGLGRGTGMGRGMGGGGGRCRQWAGSSPQNPQQGWDPGPASAGTPDMSGGGTADQTLEGLKARVDDLHREIEALETRIKSAKTEG